MAMPVGGNSRSNPDHAMLHTSLHYNVKAFNAVGDGVADDTQAIRDAIVAAYAAKAAVYFPTTTASYKITSTIDLTSYPGTRLIGGEAGVGSTLGAKPPMVKITPTSSLYPVFKFAPAAAGAANLVFENLFFNDTALAVKISDAANVWFKNCEFVGFSTADADNSCVLLENCFWVWFDECTFLAPTTSKPAVKLKGKEPSPDVDHCYLIHFRHCRFWNNGVLYKDENEVAVDASDAERITFEDCDTESFATTSALIDFQKTAGTNWGGRYVAYLSMRNCAAYDFTGTPCAVRFQVSNGINNAFFENVLFPRLIERPAGGTGGIFRTLVTGFAGNPVVDSTGAALTTGALAFSGSDGEAVAMKTLSASGNITASGGTVTIGDGTVTKSVGTRFAINSGLLVNSAGEFIEFQENGVNDAAAGAADTGRLYVRDNGVGKTQLCVRFNTGAVQVIATQP